MSWEKIGTAITFYCHFVASKLGKTGLTVTVDVYKVTTAGSATKIVTGGSATEVGGGVYLYTLASGSVDAIGEYVAVFATADTSVDQRHLPSLWTVGRANIEYRDAATSTRLASASYTAPPSAATNASQVRTELATELARIDVATSTRLASASYTTPPTSAANADAVWDEALSGHAVAGSTGASLSAASAAGDPWAVAVPGSYGSGTAGAAVGRISTTGFTLISQVATNGDVSLMDGDDYLAADNRALGYSFTTCPALTGATIAMRVEKPGGALSFAGTVTGAASCRVELTAAQVATIGVGVWLYDLQATLSNGHVVTLVQANVTVTGDV